MPVRWRIKATDDTDITDTTSGIKSVPVRTRPMENKSHGRHRHHGHNFGYKVRARPCPSGGEKILHGGELPSGISVIGHTLIGGENIL